MFADFTQDEWVRLGAVVLLAAMPAVIWFWILFSGRKTSRWPLLLAFFLGTLTVLPLILLYDYLWVWFPRLDVYHIIEENITDSHIAAIVTLLVVGMLEELVKSGVVRFIGKTRIGIQNINDAVKYSVLAGLGFAFSENIFYFYGIWTDSGFLGLLPNMTFRSIFTVCAHMVFSGIFGYFFGLAQFSKPIMETKLWLGEKSKSVQWAAGIMGTNEANAFSQLTLLKGLIIAMFIHAAFNLLLEYEQFFPVVLIVLFGFLYLMYLLAHKAGAIAFAGEGKISSMARRDEDTVLELLAMWTKEGRYKDVVDICQRLLIRDPDNKVVQLFQAKAMDQQKLTDLEASFTSLFLADEEKKNDPSFRNLVKQKVLMEMLKEKQGESIPPTVQTLPSTGGPMVPKIPKMPTVPQQNGPSSLQ